MTNQMPRPSIIDSLSFEIFFFGIQNKIFDIKSDWLANYLKKWIQYISSTLKHSSGKVEGTRNEEKEEQEDVAEEKEGLEMEDDFEGALGNVEKDEEGEDSGDDDQGLAFFESLNLF